MKLFGASLFKEYSKKSLSQILRSIDLKGQMNQNFDIFYFSSILVKCVQDEPNKHTMKFQFNWSKRLRDIRN